MPLIGTAGHVDHGKSTLIQRITGRDPDRWEEERRRGLTIDLGFAWTTLPDGTEVSFVDVPGHERYLKNMLAGVEAVDVALFVVAADEGWMPQSEEHLAILDLLDVRRGVVALTKVDAVDADLAELAHAEVADRLVGTSLEAAPIHRVSGVTGEGVEGLLDELAGLVRGGPDITGRPRLWVDRSFTIPGAGTVVTGSLLGAPLSVDDTLEIHPWGLRCRVRGLQSHEQSHDAVEPGRRVAVNLSGVDHHQVERGDMLGIPGQWELTSRFAVHLRRARFVDELEQRGAYQIHIGSSAQRVDVVGLDDGVAVLQVHRPLPLAVGDRFILRDTGRHLVVGGGRVLDPAPGRTRNAMAASREIDPDANLHDIAQRLLTSRRIDRISRLMAHSGGGSPTDAVIVGDRALDPSLVDELERRAVTMVEAEHTLHPLRPGLSLATLAERLGVESDIAEVLVARSERLERRGPDVALPEHQAGLTAKQESAWQTARDHLEESLAVPDDTNLGLDPELLHLKVRSGELVRISPNLVYLPAQIEALKEAMASLGGEFTVAEFRDAAGLSRKYAVPILEWSDKEGLTVRRGDVRRLR
ncbi:MAG TPA: selenocysteine-specific translation elongation factor [Acidimicrobiia bacterium]